MRGDETQTELHFLIRDHDREKFEAKKQFLTQAADFLNAKYGQEGTVEVVIKDSYYNMKEQIEPPYASSTGPGRPWRRRE